MCVSQATASLLERERRGAPVDYRLPGWLVDSMMIAGIPALSFLLSRLGRFGRADRRKLRLAVPRREMSFFIIVAANASRSQPVKGCEPFCVTCWLLAAGLVADGRISTMLWRTISSRPLGL
jgi:hypothetical protein